MMIIALFVVDDLFNMFCRPFCYIFPFLNFILSLIWTISVHFGQKCLHSDKDLFVFSRFKWI